MVRGCSPAVCNCRRELYTTGQGERKDAGGADLVPLPLISRNGLHQCLIKIFLQDTLSGCYTGHFSLEYSREINILAVPWQVHTQASGTNSARRAAAESCELWVAPIMAKTRAEDNDTPDQSQSERENVAGNEVGQRIGEIPVESVRRRSLGASRSRG